MKYAMQPVGLTRLLRYKTKIVNGFEFRIMGLLLAALAPLISEPVDSLSVLFLTFGFVLVVIGFRQKKVVREMSLTSVAFLFLVLFTCLVIIL